MSQYCTHCGAEIPDEAKFCTNCGAPVGEEPQTEADEQPDAAPTSAPTEASDSAAAQPSAPAKIPTTRKVLIALVAALVVVCVGVFVLFMLKTSSEDSGQQTTQAQSADSGSDSSQQQGDSQSSDDAQSGEGTSDVSAMVTAYNTVLDNAAAGQYDFTNPEYPEAVPVPNLSDYPEEYALYDINDDGTPELLVARAAEVEGVPAYSQNVIAFTFDGNAATQLSGAVTLYVTTSGTHMETSLYDKEGNGFYVRTYDRNGYYNGTEITPDPEDPTAPNTYSFSTVTMENGALITSEYFDEVPSDVGDMIEFTEVGDRTVLESLPDGTE